VFLAHKDVSGAGRVHRRPVWEFSRMNGEQLSHQETSATPVTEEGE